MPIDRSGSVSAFSRCAARAANAVLPIGAALVVNTSCAITILFPDAGGGAIKRDKTPACAHDVSFSDREARRRGPPNAEAAGGARRTQRATLPTAHTDRARTRAR